MKARSLISALLLALALIAGTWLGYRQILPPPLPEGFEEKERTLEQAGEGPDLALMLSHVKAMSGEAHPVDSPGLRRAQEYLKAQLLKMGYQPQTQRHSLSLQDIIDIRRERAEHRGEPFEPDEGIIRYQTGMGEREAISLHNIVVTLDAPDTEETVILAAHTDSVLEGPGAFDDIMSVAALLEGLRQLRGVTPARDLVFLFSDGEEQGMLGAARFVSDHPQLRPLTRLVVNVEARGNRGALMLFESSDSDLGMVRTFAEAAPHPLGFSIARQVYRMMSNDTDLSRFFMAGYPGINLAVVDGAEVYHTEEDNYQNVDRASAGHYLTTLSGLISHLATAPELRLQADENAVFFPLLPGRLAVLPQRTADLLAWLAAGLYLLALIALAVSGRLRLRAWLRGLVTQLGIIALSAGLSWLAVRLTMRLTGREDYYDMLGYAPAGLLFVAMLAAFSLLAALLGRRCLAKGEAPQARTLGALLIPSALALLTTYGFASASYLFSIPVLLGLAALALRRFTPLRLPEALCCFVILLLYVPLTALVFTALSFNTAYAAVLLWMLGFTTMLGITLPGRAR